MVQNQYLLQLDRESNLLHKSSRGETIVTPPALAPAKVKKLRLDNFIIDDGENQNRLSRK